MTGYAPRIKDDTGGIRAGATPADAPRPDPRARDPQVPHAIAARYAFDGSLPGALSDHHGAADFDQGRCDHSRPPRGADAAGRDAAVDARADRRTSPRGRLEPP